MELQISGARMGETAGTLQVSDMTFGREFNEPLIHQVVTAFMAGSRAGTRAQKTRAQVRGGGIKPWRQKGSGRARAGTIRSPLWRTGGKTFAAVPQDWSQKVNRKMYRGALRSILSELVRQERLVVVERLAVTGPKTKALALQLRELGLERVLIIGDIIDTNLYLAARNLPHVDVCEAASIDPVSLIGYDKVLMTVGAVRKFEETLS